MAKFTTTIRVEMTLTAKNQEYANDYAKEVQDEMIHQAKNSGAKKVTASVGEVTQVVKQ